MIYKIKFIRSIHYKKVYMCACERALMRLQRDQETSYPSDRTFCKEIDSNSYFSVKKTMKPFESSFDYFLLKVKRYYSQSPTYRNEGPGQKILLNLYLAIYTKMESKHGYLITGASIFVRGCI